MQNNMFKKCIGFVVAALVLGTILGPTANSEISGNEQVIDTFANYGASNNLGGYTDITVQEAQNLLTDTSNGVQIPIDVRTDGEWYNERIDTPYPEEPKHYCLSNLQDENGLQEFISIYNGMDIVVYCKSGGRSGSAVQIIDGSEFNGKIYNMLGGITAWKGAGFQTKTGNQPPDQPDKPSGPTTCNIEGSYTFSTAATDPDDDTIKYGYDWNGDSIVDEWTCYYLPGAQVNMSHKWISTGTYNVKVIAEDNVGDQSDFSEILTVVLFENNPPDIPNMAGPSSGKAGEEHRYTISAIDSDGDDVYYFIDWGDGEVEEWIGPYDSDEEITLPHSWDEKDDYTIKVKAKDVYDAESSWATLEVSMPKSKAVGMLFLRFLENHLHLFPLLQQILGL